MVNKSYLSKMTIQEKYELARPYIEHGDVVFYRGIGTLAKTIQWADNGYYNHVGIVKQDSNRLLTIDAWYKGITEVPLSDRINDYDGGDFCILKFHLPYNKRKQGVDWCTDQLGKNKGYDRLTLVRHLLALKAGIDVKWIGKPDKFVCSEFFQSYTVALGLSTYKASDLLTPHDGIRSINVENSMLIFNEVDLSKYNKPKFK